MHVFSVVWSGHGRDPHVTCGSYHDECDLAPMIHMEPLGSLASKVGWQNSVPFPTPSIPQLPSSVLSLWL